jgi:hypothetical protein
MPVCKLNGGRASTAYRLPELHNETCQGVDADVQDVKCHECEDSRFDSLFRGHDNVFGPGRGLVAESTCR